MSLCVESSKIVIFRRWKIKKFKNWSSNVSQWGWWKTLKHHFFISMGLKRIEKTLYTGSCEKIKTRKKTELSRLINKNNFLGPVWMQHGPWFQNVFTFGRGNFFFLRPDFKMPLLLGPAGALGPDLGPKFAKKKN